MDTSADQSNALRREYQVHDIFPDRDFTKMDQLRVAAEISSLLTDLHAENRQ